MAQKKYLCQKFIELVCIWSVALYQSLIFPFVNNNSQVFG